MKNINKDKIEKQKEEKAKKYPKIEDTKYGNGNKQSSDNDDIQRPDIDKNIKEQDNIITNEPIVDIVDPLIESEPIIPEYAKVQSTGDATPIPEEPIERPIIDFNDNNNENVSNTSFKDNKEKGDNVGGNNNNTNTQGDKPKKGYDPANIDLSEKDNKEKNESAKSLAKTVVDGYEMAHALISQKLQKSDESLMKDAVKGKIELEAINSEIDLGGGNIIKIKGLIKDYNTTIGETLIVSQEFKDEMIPLLQEEFKARGIGMTRFERIIALTSKDIVPKITKVVELNSTFNALINHVSTLIKSNRQMMEAQQNNGSVSEAIIIDTPNNDYKEPEENINR